MTTIVLTCDRNCAIECLSTKKLTPSSSLASLESTAQDSCSKRAALSCTRVLVQAAFKRNPLGSNSKAEAGLPEGALPSQVEDWDAGKAEDKTLHCTRRTSLAVYNAAGL